jgi:manganese transport protein
MGNLSKQQPLVEEITSISWKDYLKALGPGAIMAASIIGPGSVTTASVMGAKYGYYAIWVLALAAVFAYFFQEPALRITLFKKISIMEGVRKEIGKPVSALLYLSLLAGALAFQAGNFTGAAMALHYVFPFLSIFGWASTMAISALIICWFGVYGIIENINRVLIGLMVLAFVITAFYSGPSITRVIKEGFAFRVPGGKYKGLSGRGARI